jgi:hypothetical protein
VGECHTSFAAKVSRSISDLSKIVVKSHPAQCRALIQAATELDQAFKGTFFQHPRALVRMRGRFF